MKKNSVKLIYKTSLACMLIMVCSCKKVLDLKAKDAVDAENAYQNVYDANAAIIGIYGQFLGLADRYIVLNELRADLMSPTANADVYLKQLNTHTETTDNPWADPRPWYKVILNINDAMYHFNDMLATGKLKPVDYQQRYSDIGTLRCFLYLQLGIQYGTIPYVTDPVSNLTDLGDATKFPRLTLDQLIPKLAAFMNDPSRYLDLYPTSDPINGSTSTILNTTVDGNTTGLIFINKYAFQGEINLWAGNYNTASKAYRTLSDYGVAASGFNNGAVNYYEQYKVANSQFCEFCYTAGNENLLIDGVGTWREFFSQTASTHTNDEWIWRIPFSTTFGPVNPFVDLFDNQGGKYQLTASQAVINYWNAQTQTSGYPYDPRIKVSVRTINGQTVIAKQLYPYWNATNFAPVSPLVKTGNWMLYRSAALTQHFAEAALNDGQVQFAYAMANIGFRLVYSTGTINPATNGASGVPSDPTNVEQTFLPAPYDLDARLGPNTYHGIWYRQIGTRTRANLVGLPVSYYNTGVDVNHQLENAIIDDNARELAFEGYRWGDLVRIARRRGDPSYLANKVYNKLLLENNPAAAAVQAKLMDPNGWYMPFKIQ